MDSCNIVMETFGDDFCTRYGATKPPFPYTCGRELLLLPYRPPPPVERPKLGLVGQRRIERIKMHPLDCCFLHPPAPGTVIGGGAPLRLRIIAPLDARDGRTAQLLIAETVVDAGSAQALGAATVTPAVDKGALPPPPPPGELIVAKIFDPLYHDHQQDDTDPFLLADAAYANEAAAYAKLAALQGGVVPRYYGAYTFDLWQPSDAALALTAAAPRAVRAVLVEYVRGRTLRDLDPRRFSQRARQRIISDIIDAETAVFAAGVFHRDVYPRNVLVVDDALPLLLSSTHFDSEEAQPQQSPVPSLTNSNADDQEQSQTALGRPHVPSLRGGDTDLNGSDVGNGVGGRTSSAVLIDFGKVSVQSDRAQWPFSTLFAFTGIHVPPLLRWHQCWWSQRQAHFEEWIDWEWQPWLEERYGHRERDITEDMRQQWLPERRMKRLRISLGQAERSRKICRLT
jgi:hypothetical protein